MRGLRAIMWCLVLVFAGCDEAPSDSVASGQSLRVGASPPGVFREYKTGDTLVLQRGLQGAQHVYVGVAVRSPSAADGVRLDARLFNGQTGEMVSLPLTLDVYLEHEASASLLETDHSGWRFATGLLLVVPDPQPVVGNQAELQICVTEWERETRCATYRGVVRWGADDTTAH